MRQMRLLAALWALRSSATGAPTNGTQPAAPTNTTPALCQDSTACDAIGAGAPRNSAAAAARVAVLLPGEMRFPDFDNLAASLAAFDVFISTYAEDEDRARRLRPTGLVLTPRAEVSLASGRMYQWYHLDRLLREFKDALLAYDVLFRTRTDARRGAEINERTNFRAHVASMACTRDVKHTGSLLRDHDAGALSRGR